MKSKLGVTATSVLAIVTILGLSSAHADPNIFAGQWEGSGAISVATVVGDGTIEFTPVTRTGKSRTPWTKVQATVTSQNDSRISLRTRTYTGKNATPPMSATFDATKDTITWPKNVVWKRTYDPNLAKLKQTEVQSQLEAANQRARDLENQLNQNQTVSAQAVATLQGELARLLAAQQASDAQRAELAKTLEGLQTKAEEKKVIEKDATIVVAGTTPTDVAPAVPQSGRTLRVRNNGGYVATFYARWVNKSTLKPEDWNSGRITAGFEASLEVPANAVNVELWAVGHGAGEWLKDQEIFRTGEIDLGKKYIVTGTIGGNTKFYTE